MPAPPPPASVLDLVIVEKLHQLGRAGLTPEQIAARVVPGKLFMAAEPRPTVTLRVRATGEIHTQGSESLLERYAGRDDLEAEVGRIPPRKAAQWAWNQRILEEIRCVWQEQSDANLIHYKDETTIGGFLRYVMDAAGSTRWRDPGDRALDYAPGFGGRGIEFLTEAGRVFLDAGPEGRAVYLAQLAVERKGTGMGDRLMEAVRAYAEEKGLGVVVYKVCNHRYFERFPWLTRKDGGMSYEGSHADLVSAAAPGPR